MAEESSDYLAYFSIRLAERNQVQDLSLPFGQSIAERVPKRSAGARERVGHRSFIAAETQETAVKMRCLDQLCVRSRFQILLKIFQVATS